MKNLEQIKKSLDSLLLNRETRVDRFDGDYLDDFHFIMKENYNIDSIGDESNQYFNLLRKNYPEAKKITDFNSLIRQTEGLDLKNYGPALSSNSTKEVYGYTKTSNWSEINNVRKNKDNIDFLNNLQAEYSKQSGGEKNVSPAEFWVREGTTEKKEKIFSDICSTGERKKVLCIGPRWVDEIIFISNRFKCDAVGLDLFSKNESLITIGDMHDMPFEDNSFDIVYQKNTFNKAYDIRECLNECVRVLKPQGVIISDECLSYTIGVNEIARTSINRNSWYEAYLGNFISEILADVEVNANASWIKLAGLFAAKIKK